MRNHFCTPNQASARSSFAKASRSHVGGVFTEGQQGHLTATPGATAQWLASNT